MKINALFLLALLSSCRDNPLHLNHAVYKIKPGEVIEIYTTTNSCCHYCEPDPNKFHCISFEKRETVEKAPEDCDGCSSTEGWKFRALRPGKDTVLFRLVVGGENCSDSLKVSEKYMVIVDQP
jgi:TusA-related sulfurtransferase